MQLPISEKLPINQLSNIFHNMSESYKIFWFQALVEQVKDNRIQISYNNLINSMIASAWYMVAEYKLNLGPFDTLENVVLYAYKLSGLKSSEKRENILAFLVSCEDRELHQKKMTLTQNVPYRLQAPLMPDIKGKMWDNKNEVMDRINKDKRLMYYFDYLNGLQRSIIINDCWVEYIESNYNILMGWVQYNLVEYLQRRNPSVPGIINKLYAPNERKLEKVKKYWKTVLEIKPIINIYTKETLDVQDVSIDHFVPWSYVTHDEFWNLLPTSKSLNSSKSNNLPNWDVYFPKLGHLEYEVFKLSQQYDKVRHQFEICRREHINNAEIVGRLYSRTITENEFINNLSIILEPVYLSARNMGYEEWAH